MLIRDNLLSRFKPKWDDILCLHPAKIALMQALNTNDDVRERHAALAKDAGLSAIGRQDKMRGYIAETVAARLHRVSKSVQTMRAKLNERRAKLQPPAPDKSNVAAAVLRSEMRQMLRGMSNGARTQLLLSQDADPALLDAVLEAPNFSSGISDQIRGMILNAVIEKTYPGQLKIIEEIEEAIELVNASVGVTLNTVRAACEFPSDQVLSDFLQASTRNTAAVDAEIDRHFSAISAVAA